MLRSPSATLPLSPLNGGAASSSFYVSSQLEDSAVQAYFDGDFELSLKSLTTALKTQQLTLGDVDIVVAHTLGNIGTVYIAMGLLEEAMHVLQESLNIKMTLRTDPNTYPLPSGSNAVIVADTLTNLGSASFLRAEYFDAMSYYQSCLKELTEGPVPGSKTDIANVLYNIGNVHCLLNEPDDALMAMAESLQLTHDTLNEGKEGPQAAEAMEKIGAIYLSQNKLDDAMTAFLEALVLTKAALGSEHVDCAVSIYNCGLVYERMGETRRAIDSYNSALGLFKINGVVDTISVEMVRQRVMNIQVLL
jgi:tetratricopeptide (TPR) repeat protein